MYFFFYNSTKLAIEFKFYFSCPRSNCNPTVLSCFYCEAQVILKRKISSKNKLPQKQGLVNERSFDPSGTHYNVLKYLYDVLIGTKRKKKHSWDYRFALYEIK